MGGGWKKLQILGHTGIEVLPAGTWESRNASILSLQEETLALDGAPGGDNALKGRYFHQKQSLLTLNQGQKGSKSGCSLNTTDSHYSYQDSVK